jgi:hypothetical protein
MFVAMFGQDGVTRLPGSVFGSLRTGQAVPAMFDIAAARMKITDTAAEKNIGR